MSRLQAVVLTKKQADMFVERLHRHHRPVQIDKYRVGVACDGHLVGVVQVNRPVNTYLDDGKTLEIVRLCTDGTENACSFLYGRAAKIAELMGYERIITYTLESEPGNSLLASGFTLDAISPGGEWSHPSRLRRPADNPGKKKRWIRILREPYNVVLSNTESRVETFQTKITDLLEAVQ